jgi:hypothetical protein
VWKARDTSEILRVWRDGETLQQEEAWLEALCIFLLRHALSEIDPQNYTYGGETSMKEL